MKNNKYPNKSIIPAQDRNYTITFEKEYLKIVYNKLYNKKVIVFDGVCALCNNFVIFVIKNDKKISTNLFPTKYTTK